MKQLKSLLVLGSLLALLAPVSAAAQDTTAEVSDSSRIQLGPLGLSPRIALKNLGIDTNVLNQPANTQRDFTTTLVPGVDSSLRIGRGRLTGKTDVELVYFSRTSSQRSLGYGQQGRFDLVLESLTPYLTTGRVKTYRRPNAEIDARVGQTTTSFGFGANLRLSWRTIVQVDMNQNTLKLDDEQFLGVSLSEALDRRSQTANVNLRVALTPLTTFVIKNTLQYDRFTFSAERDADSLSVIPGFEFKPSALVAGSAFAGYRIFQARHATRSAFTGVVAAVGLSYVLRDTMRIEGKVHRDIEYSAQAAGAYFLVTEGSLSLTQSLGGNWDAVGRWGRQSLDYRSLNLQDTADNRRDRTVTAGTGLGYRLRSDARVGFDADYFRRLSPLAARRYSGFRFGGSFTYGT